MNTPLAVIALIVLFQPELRKFFERAASMRSARTRDPGDVTLVFVVDVVGVR